MLTMLMPCAAVHTQGGCGPGEQPAAASLARPACALCGPGLWSQHGPAQDCMPGLLPFGCFLMLPDAFAFASALHLHLPVHLPLQLQLPLPLSLHLHLP